MLLGHLYWRMSGGRVFFFLIGAACVGASVVVFAANLREKSHRAQCARNATQLVFAQRSYARSQSTNGRPIRYFSGVPIPPGAIAENRYPELQKSDASRVLTYLIRMNGIASAAGLVCPSDPFIAPLDFTSADMALNATNEVDFPVEGKALGLGQWRWASANSVATREDGRTWFSYSMQTASLNRDADLKPIWGAEGVRGLHPKIPMFSDRNPECDVFRTLGAAGVGPLGNSRNHNGEGQTLAFQDGRSEFLTDAGKLELPLDPSKPSSATGFDHLYNDEPIAQGESRSGRRCIPVGTFGQTLFFNAWMTD